MHVVTKLTDAEQTDAHESRQENPPAGGRQCHDEPCFLMSPKEIKSIDHHLQSFQLVVTD